MLNLKIILTISLICIAIPFEDVFADVSVIEMMSLRYQISEPIMDTNNNAVKLGFEQNYSENPIEILDIPLQGIRWIELHIINVDENQFSVKTITALKDGSEVETKPISHAFGSTGLFLEQEPSIGDKIYSQLTGGFVTYSQILSIKVGDKNREAFVFTSQQFGNTDNYVMKTSNSLFYDRETGILLKWVGEGEFAGSVGLAQFTGSTKFGIEAIKIEIPILSQTGGCLIATATYGSELMPQVQNLREIRDNKLMKTESGESFMAVFNQVYYSFSPYIADYERENPAFKEMVKIGITPMLSTLSIMSLADSEQETLGYGIGVILMNIGMYVGIPLGIVIFIKNRK